MGDIEKNCTTALISGLEVISGIPDRKGTIKTVLFDFDGTISTLRQGWEDIMEPFMIEMICGDSLPDTETIEKVRDYIDASTGIQTIYQMQWLAEEVSKKRYHAMTHDEWWYKEEYNRRLLLSVKRRIEMITRGEKKPEEFMIYGAEKFIKSLADKGIELYIASGTDHDDILKEAKMLGIDRYFMYIAGAPLKKKACSKEAVINDLLNQRKIDNTELLIVGDGKVEIELGIRAGALTLGMATDEVNRSGISLAKRRRLIRAGAHAIAGDYTNCHQINQWLGLSQINN